MTTIDAAIKTVNTQRSELGAVSNRLNHTVNNLTNISANLSVARGGIEDADFALETTKLAKNQILQQASTAMLAQANASKKMCSACCNAELKCEPLYFAPSESFQTVVKLKY